MNGEIMIEKPYLCLTDDSTYDEDEIRICSDCGKKTCPDCGGDVQTVEEYDEAMRINSER